MNKKVLALLIACHWPLLSIATAQNVQVTNNAAHPVPVTISGGGTSGTVTQGSTTAGQSGMLGLGAVTTAAPSYTTAQTSALSLTLAGLLRVDGSGVTQPVSAASLPLPTGAATSGNQSTIITSLSSIDGKAAGDTTNGNKVQVKIWTGPANTANGQVATSTTSGVLKASNATRRRITFKNTDAAITVYIGTGTVTAANGFPLKAGESYTKTTTAAVNVIAASGTPTVAYDEESD